MENIFGWLGDVGFGREPIILVSSVWKLMYLTFPGHSTLKWVIGGTVVKVLCYKSEGRWFDSRWCHLNFSLT